MKERRFIMRFLIQEVKKASVTVDNELISKIEKGLLIFVGVNDADNTDVADKMLKKAIGLRIFPDDNGKTNLSLKDVSGDLLIVSQFTLYADCKKGNRPSFINAGKQDHANDLYEYIIDKAQNEYGLNVGHGIFGADMKVELINDGPFTIFLDSDVLFS